MYAPERARVREPRRPRQGCRGQIKIDADEIKIDTDEIKINADEIKTDADVMNQRCCMSDLDSECGCGQRGTRRWMRIRGCTCDSTALRCISPWGLHWRVTNHRCRAQWGRHGPCLNPKP